MKRIAINTDRDGCSRCIPAVYFKQGAYNFMKDCMMDMGGQKEHAFTGVIEIYDTDTDKLQ